MTEIFQGLLDQFSTVLDTSMVQPLFGLKNLFWLFLVIEIVVRLYLGYASRTLTESDPDNHQDLVRRFWIKIVLLIFFLRPVFMASNPDSGRYTAFLFNELINGFFVLSAFLRLRYIRADETRFEEWTELDAAEGMMEEKP